MISFICSRRARTFLAALALLLSACAGFRPEDQFVPATRDFSERLRWGDFRGAARHFAEPHGREFLEIFTALEDLHITDVRLESSEYRAEDGRMVAWMMMEYFLLPSLTIKKFQIRQEWVFDTAGSSGGSWRLVSPFPPFP